jgi:hypothetical protein
MEKLQGLEDTNDYKERMRAILANSGSRERARDDPRWDHQ